MTQQKNDGGAAFPHKVKVLDPSSYPAPTYVDRYHDGMSLRDYFAIHADVPWNAAIETLKLRGNDYPTIHELAEYRAKLKYAEADAMLAERSK